ncbi:MAG: efflux RND transporter periplasmic adaptor subunit [Pseudomonadota bacterium]
MRGSHIWATIMTIGIVGWMATGNVIIGGQGPANPDGSPVEEPTAEQQAAAEPSLFRVQVENISAEPRIATLSARGQTEARDHVIVQAQTDGLVTEIAVEKGDRVNAGDLLCRIETGARAANVASAEAAFAQAQLDFDAQSRLSERGFAAEIRVKTAKAALDAAQANLDIAKLALERTEITAPFSGVVDTVPVELGSRLGVGMPCAQIVSLDPIRVAVQISEREIGNLSIGMPGSIDLVDGSEADGTIRFIAPTADASTRTYRVEFDVPNPDNAIRAGMTAEASVNLDSALAHLISPAYLVLNDAGTVGVRTIGAENQVEFMPITIVADTSEGMWVAGLPSTVTIVTVGQDFVSEGQSVEPVFETAETAQLSEMSQ